MNANESKIRELCCVLIIVETLLKNYLVEFKKTESQTFRVCPVIIHNFTIKSRCKQYLGLKTNLECYLNGKTHRTT